MSASGCALDDARLQALLAEDAPFGDLSTQALGLGPGGERGTTAFHARASMVAAGTEEAARLFELCGCRVRAVLASGTHAQAGTLLLAAEGPADALLLAWKVAQNLVEFAAGIASATAAIVGALRAAGCPQPVAATRKNVPGTRALSAKAVRAGGGTMHRLGLSDSLLVFPEHRGFITPAELPRRLAALRQQQPEKKLVAEAADLQQALELARLGVEVLQLERFLPQAVAELRLRLSQQGLDVLVAAAGGITLANAVDYARAGADVIVTSAPYVAPPRDVRVSINPA